MSLLLKRIVTVICFVVLLVPAISATPPRPLRLVEFGLNFVERPSRPGPAAIELGIKRNSYTLEIRNITVKVRTVGRLTCYGETQWKEPLNDTVAVTRRIDFVIPLDDTCGIEFEYWLEDGRGPVGGASAYFISEGDSVSIFQSDPRGPDYPRPEIPIADRPPTGRRVKGEFPHSDSLYPITDDTIELPKITYGTLTKLEMEQEKQRKLERFPLTDQYNQYLTVNGQLLVRYRGETKFHPAVPIKDTGEWIKKKRDSAVFATQDRKSPTWLDLRKPEDLAFARTIIDSLTPTDTPGVYIARISRYILDKIHDRDIPFRIIKDPSRKPKIPPRRHPPDSSSGHTPKKSNTTGMLPQSQ